MDDRLLENTDDLSRLGKKRISFWFQQNPIQGWPTDMGGKDLIIASLGPKNYYSSLLSQKIEDQKSFFEGITTYLSISLLIFLSWKLRFRSRQCSPGGDALISRSSPNVVPSCSMIHDQTFPPTASPPSWVSRLSPRRSQAQSLRWLSERERQPILVLVLRDRDWEFDLLWL